MSIKIALLKQCNDFVDARHEIITNTILEIQEALNSETKSSAGDKHETGRAMLQIEREKAGHQLAEIQKVREALAKIDKEKTSKSVALGSVVITSERNYFIAISAGELKVADEVFYAISPSTPIGQLLMGKTAGDKLVFRQETFVIKEIL